MGTILFLGILIFLNIVNNVGRSHEFPVSFAQTLLEEQQAIIEININGTLRVSKIVLNKMLEQYVFYLSFSYSLLFMQLVLDDVG